MKNQAFKIMGMTALVVTLGSLAPVQEAVDDAAFKVTQGSLSVFQPVAEKRWDIFNAEMMSMRKEFGYYAHPFEKDILGIEKEDMQSKEFYQNAMEELAFDKNNLTIQQAQLDKKIKSLKREIFGEEKPIVIDLMSIENAHEKMDNLRAKPAASQLKPV